MAKTRGSRNYPLRSGQLGLPLHVLHFLAAESKRVVQRVIRVDLPETCRQGQRPALPMGRQRSKQRRLFWNNGHVGNNFGQTRSRYCGFRRCW